MRLRSLFALVALALALSAAWPAQLPEMPPARSYDVRVLRDTWGVPHVFGHTDADVAFGLAYAHAEDDFATIQGALLAARGRLASEFGPGAAPNDYMVQLLRVWDVVDSQYATALGPQTRALCQAYADGLNHYATTHPRQAIASLYPVRGQDVVAGFVHKLPLFFGVDRVLKGLLAPPETTAPLPGSNTFAVAPARSADGWTRLAINSHQPWEGPVAWYEAHLHSEEGWDMVGGLFPGAPLILHGHNRDLGWAHTVNHPDLVDVYALELNPANPNQYRFDGQWLELEARPAKVTVKLAGPFRWTFMREVLWSRQGPVLRTPRGTFALRFAGFGEVRHIEQWYRMNKAHSRDEWEAAMRLAALPMFNTGYADRGGHIGYVYNARLPLRDPGFDWRKPVAGNTSRTLWTQFLPWDELPSVRDPPSGFVQNCNSSPFQTTQGPGNPDPQRYPAAFGIETGMTNRALRVHELFDNHASITREEFDAIKFDLAYSPRSALALRLRQLLDAGSPSDAQGAEAAQTLAGWDLRVDAANPRAALALLTLRPDDGNDGTPVATEMLRERLRQAARTLRSQFGRLEVPWGEVNRLRRGGLDLGVGGGPDVLRAVYAKPQDDGRLVGHAGDSYLLLVEWDTTGQVHSRSINTYGSAVGDRRSRHYADQAPLFARQELRPVWLDEAEIRRHLEREYRP